MIIRNNYLQTLQRKWADKLHRKTSEWTKGQKIIFLLSIYVFIGGSSIYCLTNVGSNNSTFKTLLKTPERTYRTQPSFPTPESFNFHVDSQLLKQFYRKYDSLMQTESGERQIEDFKQNRPGFFDSLTNASSLFNHLIIP